MTGVLQGTVPYPPNANASPIQRLASDLQRMSQGLQQGSQKLNATAQAAGAAWVGKAAEAYQQHTNERARVVASVAQSIASTVPVLQGMASAIVSTQAAYNAAVIKEQIARAGMPYTAGALAAAIAMEGKAVLALQTAGGACAASLAMIELEIAAAQFFGVDRQSFQAAKDGIVGVWESAKELMETGDIDAAVGVLNSAQVTMPQSDGTAQRTNAIGWLLNGNEKVKTAWEAMQSLAGSLVLLTEPPLDAMERPELANDFDAAGFSTTPTSRGEIGRNMELTELAQRPAGIEPDQSMVIAHTLGTDTRDGSRVLTITVPGIVDPTTGAINGGTGARNVVNASGSQITGFGQEEAALSAWIRQQGIGEGDTVNVYGHSQGGIVGRNLANDLAARGIKVNLVAYGSPDGPLREGVNAWLYQNPRDPVPATRLAGDGGVTNTLHRGQYVIPVEFDAGTLFDNHAASAYGHAIDQMPAGAHPGNDALDRHLADQARYVRLDGGVRVTTFEGPTNTHGEPISVPAPGDGGYRIGDRAPVPN